jgi:hypothetical protein
MLQSTTIKEANEGHHKAADEVARLLMEATHIKEQSIRETETAPSIISSVTTATAPRSEDAMTRRVANAVVSEQRKEFNPYDSETNYLSYIVEDMPNLFCYQILLRQTNIESRSTVALDQVSVTLLPGLNHTIVDVGMNRDEGPFLQMFLKKSVQQTPRVYLVDQGRTVSLRLSYLTSEQKFGNNTDHDDAAHFMKPDQANALACKSCGQGIFSNGAIERTLPLPSGHWEGLDDYLMCYEGQSTVQFGAISSGAQQHCLLLDSTVLVAHADDMGSSVCVLAQTGYGEAAQEEANAVAGENDGTTWDPSDAQARGSRPWREAVGGATLTCSLCTQTLGVAPFELPDSYRIFRHQLIVVTSDSQECPLSTIGSFVANEMVRYAQTAAIYSFSIILDDDRKHKKCLMVRLLSWETHAASSEHSRIDESGVHRLEWRRVAKLLFEETETENTGPEQWMWNVDWCCPPSAADTLVKASSIPMGSRSQVRLCLSLDDWGEFRNQLSRASSSQSQEVVEATFLAKTGRSVGLHDGMGLAAIAL